MRVPPPRAVPARPAARGGGLDPFERLLTALIAVLLVTNAVIAAGGVR